MRHLSRFQGLLLLPWLAFGPTSLTTAQEVASRPSPGSHLGAAEGLSHADRAGLAEALDRARHSLRRTGQGHLGQNLSQGWSLEFDGLGLDAVPNDRGWSWGLELEGYGFEGLEHAVQQPESTRVEGHRLTYVWDDLLEEWYVNGADGVEHGFTLQRRPAVGAAADRRGALVVRLAVRGDLSPRAGLGDTGIRFVDEAGETKLVYAGLFVFDADGEDVPARLQIDGRGISIHVDEAGATYPLTIDPTAQQAYLKASNSGVEDRFGGAVALSGNTVAIGAQREDSGSIGVNASGADNSAGNAGAVYVFVRNGATWTQQAYIKASNTDPRDGFGTSVALSGDTLVVGAPSEASMATGVNGAEGDNSANDAGAAYVFVRSGTTWSQEAYLKASNSESDDIFGFRVAVAGDLVAVSAPYESSGSTGINGDETNNDRSRAGAVYVFARSGTAWSQEAYVKASNTDKDDTLGVALDLWGETLVVGSAGEDSAATGIHGNQADNSAPASGAVYVFVRTGTTWGQEAYVKSSNTGSADQFGVSLGLSEDTLVVGANFEDSSATGVNGNQLDNGASYAGAAYVFVRSGTSWSQEAYLKSSNTELGDSFGDSVAIDGESILVGATGESSAASGVNGNQLDNSATWSGAAYLFERTGTVWAQVAYLKAGNSGFADVFGTDVALAGSTAVVGAPREDGGSNFVNGPDDDSASGAGAAYVFEPPVASATFRNEPSNPASYSSSAPVLGAAWTATVDLTTTGHTTALVLGRTAPALVTFPGGQVVLVGGNQVFQLPATSGPLAAWSVNLPDDASLGGLTLYSQAMHFGGVAPFALSNAQDLFIGY